MTVLKLCARRPITVRVEGPLRVPVSRASRVEKSARSFGAGSADCRGPGRDIKSSMLRAWVS